MAAQHAAARGIYEYISYIWTITAGHTVLSKNGILLSKCIIICSGMEVSGGGMECSYLDAS